MHEQIADAGKPGIFEVKTSILIKETYKNNPYPILAELVAQGPVVPTKIPFVGKIKLVTTYDAVLDLLKKNEHFALDGRNAGKSSQLGMRWLPKSLLVLAQNMLVMDDPDHRRLRKLADFPFRPANIEAMRGAIARLADDLLDDLAVQENPDVVDGFCRQLPLAVICELLGLPHEDRLTFSRWMNSFGSATGILALIRVIPALKNIMNYLRKEFERRRVDPGAGLITELVQLEAAGDRLSEDELLSMTMLLFIAGHETTTHLISTSLLTLLEHRNVLEELRADWSVLPAAVEELLRYNSPVQGTKPRHAKSDMSFHGADIKRGDVCMAWLAAANMDPSRFTNPADFNIHREKHHPLGFGGGAHFCLGLQLARLETQIALERFFTRWPNAGLATSRDKLRWIGHIGMRGLKAMPLKLSG